jgi:hypothetical protein
MKRERRSSGMPDGRPGNFPNNKQHKDSRQCKRPVVRPRNSATKPKRGSGTRAERYKPSAEKEDDMKSSRHIGACIVLASSIFVFTGGSIQAQFSSGSPSSGSGNLGGSGSGLGDP